MSPKRYFFVLVGIGALILAAGGTGYYFGLGYIQSTKQTLATQMAEQEAAQAKLDKLHKLQLQYKHDVTPLLPRIEAALPPTKNQTELLAQLRDLAKGSGLTLDGASFPASAGLPTSTSQTIKAGTVLALPVTFQVQGTFSQVQNFLSRLENLGRLTNVTMLTVSRPSKDKPTIIYNMTVNAYMKP